VCRAANEPLALNVRRGGLGFLPQALSLLDNFFKGGVLFNASAPHGCSIPLKEGERNYPTNK
jgi:hypothetical protein